MPTFGSEGRVHRFVTIEQTVRATQPAAVELDMLFDEWGLTRSVQEAFWVIALDNIENLKTVTEVARGGFHEVRVQIATVLAAVLLSGTDRFYVAHNHPDGSVTPTEKDVKLTAQIMAAANAAGIQFEDHIITGPAGWFSFYDAGLLERPDDVPAAKAATSKRGGRR